MIALSDTELEQVMSACKPLAVRDRGPFLRALADEIAKHPAVGPGLIDRLIVETQRKFFDPLANGGFLPQPTFDRINSSRPFCIGAMACSGTSESESINAWPPSSTNFFDGCGIASRIKTGTGNTSDRSLGIRTAQPLVTN